MDNIIILSLIVKLEIVDIWYVCTLGAESFVCAQAAEMTHVRTAVWRPVAVYVHTDDPVVAFSLVHVCRGLENQESPCSESSLC